jgi:hypothetical protein
MKTEHINRPEKTCKLNICTQLCLRDCINEVSNKSWTQTNRIKGYKARPNQFIVGFLLSAYIHDNRIHKSPRVGLKSKLLNSNTVKELQQEMRRRKSGLNRSNQRSYISTYLQHSQFKWIFSKIEFTSHPTSMCANGF